MREGQAMGKDVRVHHSSPVLYQSLELGEGDTWIDMAADNALHSILCLTIVSRTTSPLLQVSSSPGHRSVLKGRSSTKYRVTWPASSGLPDSHEVGIMGTNEKVRKGEEFMSLAIKSAKFEHGCEAVVYVMEGGGVYNVVSD